MTKMENTCGVSCVVRMRIGLQSTLRGRGEMPRATTMRLWGICSLTLICALLLTAPAPAEVGPIDRARDQDEGKSVGVRRQGDAYCFDRPIVYGSVVIAGGRCYSFYVLRTSAGSFLGFGPSGPRMIPPGQVVRLSTPAGQKVKGRLFYLVPIPAGSLTMPADVIAGVSVQVSVQAGRLMIIVLRQRSGESAIERLELPFSQP